MRFDGKAYAREIEQGVVVTLSKRINKPKIVSILVGDDPASVLYTRLKEQAAHRVGVVFEVQRISNMEQRALKIKIAEIGARGDITGVMLQLPVVDLRGVTLKEVLNAIPLNKDVDGLRWNESGVMPATVKAILMIIDHIVNSQFNSSTVLKLGTYVVIGARGAVGKPLVHFLKKRGVTNIQEVEWDTDNPTEITVQGDIVISCTGREGIVTAEMVQEGAIVIDVGAPKGDMTEGVYQKASYVVGVPNGVGPVTVASLMANAADII